MRLTLLGSSVLVLLLLSGCGGEGEATPRSEPKPAATETVTVTATPAPPQQDGVLKAGTAGTVSFSQLTVLKLDPDVPVDFEDHKRWAAALVQTCATSDTTAAGDPLEVSWVPWTVNDAQDGSYGITDVTGSVSYPLPTYPTEPRRLAKGQCVKGWVTFNVAPGVKLTSVTYSGAGEKPLTWRF